MNTSENMLGTIFEAWIAGDRSTIYYCANLDQLDRYLNNKAGIYVLFIKHDEIIDDWKLELRQISYLKDFIASHPHMEMATKLDVVKNGFLGVCKNLGLELHCYTDNFIVKDELKFLQDLPYTIMEVQFPKPTGGTATQPKQLDPV